MNCPGIIKKNGKMIIGDSNLVLKKFKEVRMLSICARIYLKNGAKKINSACFFVLGRKYG
jgi:hypothetical protein